jgi:hypothetical protein
MDYVIFLLNYIEIVRISLALRPILHIYISTFFPLKVSQIIALKISFIKMSFVLMRHKYKDPKLVRKDLIFLRCLLKNLSIELTRRNVGMMNELSEVDWSEI